MWSQIFGSRKQVVNVILDYIDVFYNHHHKHSTPGYLAPVEYKIVM
ncbi:IS3 family transposase [Xenorhabdus littoralis]